MISSKTMPAKIFINVGNVKTITTETLDRLFTLCKGRKVYIIKTPMNKNNLTNDNIDAVVGNYSNVTVLDWSNMKKEHPEYFAFDRKHLTKNGSKAFADYIIENINQ